jgi:hypothetical protein
MAERSPELFEALVHPNVRRVVEQQPEFETPEFAHQLGTRLALDVCMFCRRSISMTLRGR